MKSLSKRVLIIFASLTAVLSGNTVAQASTDVSVTMEVECDLAEVTAPPATFEVTYTGSDTGSSSFQSSAQVVEWTPGCRGSGELKANLVPFSVGEQTIAWMDGNVYADFQSVAAGVCSFESQVRISGLPETPAKVAEGAGGVVNFCLLVRIPDTTPNGTYSSTLSFTVVPDL